MSVEWYYVDGQERVGPIGMPQLAGLVQEGTLGPESFVWREGFEDWQALKDTAEWPKISPAPTPPPPQAPPLPAASTSSNTNRESSISNIPTMGGPAPFNWNQIGENDQAIYIKIGQDRGGQEIEYGPFTKGQIARAYREERINHKTYVYAQGLDNWVFLGDTSLLGERSGQVAAIQEHERRTSPRKPFVARLLLVGRDEVFEGICRNIGPGGLQVLVANFPLGEGEHIEINVHPENDPQHAFVASGKIVRILQGGCGFAMCFENLTAEANQAIQSYLQKAA